MSDVVVPMEVFCSYSHQDELYVRKLRTHLKGLERQGLISTWHDRDILASADWVEEIKNHLETASLILLLVSADFLASDFCYEVEMQRALQRHDAGTAKVIPIIACPCDWQHSPFARLQSLPLDGKPITTWENHDLAWTDVVAGIRRGIEDLSLLSVSAKRSVLPPVWNIPYTHNPFFIGRDDLLSRLHDQLQGGQPAALSQPQAISGLGGIGKTHMAIEYAYRYRQEYEVVLWAGASNQETLIASYNTIAVLLKLPEREASEQEIMIGAVKRWLQVHDKWLLILDNADNLDLLPDFLPPVSGGHILITTRAWDMQRLAQRIEVETLPDERGLPLALDQAGAYLEATGMSLSQYQQVYQQHRQVLLRERRARITDHPEPVATTWSLSFKRVEGQNAAAAELLRLCAYLAPDAIPESIITQGAPHLGSLLGPAAADPFLLGQAIEALRTYSLIQRDPRTQILSIHRLVQAVLHDSMASRAREQWKQRAVQAVAISCPNARDVTQWEICEQWLPHAQICAKWIEQEDMIFSEAAQLLDTAGHYLSYRTPHAEAEPLLRRILEIYEQMFGADHPRTQTVREKYVVLLDKLQTDEPSS